MGTIITFYSYKGGVGRSMALANVALLLARAGKKVLMVDFDLEAPGLEQYFTFLEMSAPGSGVLDLLDDIAKDRLQAPDSYVTTIMESPTTALDLIASGRERDPVAYLDRLNSLDWPDFFKVGGGDRLEKLRTEWKRRYDFVLVDSRTGLSDSGGVCTIQLPDILAVMFTANNQSLLGARDASRLALEARRSLAYTRMSLTILPIPARIGVNELTTVQEWVGRFAEEFRDLISDWLPKGISAAEVLHRLKIPQQDYFSFGERLAVIDQGVSDFAGMGFAYSVISRVLLDDLADVASVLQLTPSPTETPKPPEEASRTNYDLYISYPRSFAEFTRVLSSSLRHELTDLLGYPPSIFFDEAEIRIGDSWRSSMNEALTTSRVFLPLLAGRAFSGSWTSMEYAVALERFHHSEVAIVPVTITKEPFVPIGYEAFTTLDFAQHARSTKPSSPSYRSFVYDVRRLAEIIAGLIGDRSNVSRPTRAKPRKQNSASGKEAKKSG